MSLVAACMLLVPSLQDPAVAERTDGQAVARRVDRWLQPFVDDDQLSGALLIAHGDDVIAERFYGFANRELEVPIDAHTRFCIASVTKPMTQFVVISLIEGGRMGTDDVLARWVPDFPNADAITVMHLLNHRAGIPHRVTAEVDEVRPQTAASMVDLARGRELLGPPGARSVYSSAGYSVLARVAELAGGKPFAELLRERVFAPAGMDETCSATSRELVPRRASCYVPVPGGMVNAAPKDLTFLVGAGSVFSTPRDLLKLVRAVVARKLGAGATANALARGSIDWNGATSGYRCFVRHDPKTGWTVVWCGNVANGAVERMRKDLMAVVTGSDVPTPGRLSVAAVPLADEDLAAITGTWSYDGTPLELRRIDGRIWLGDVVLVPIARDRFFSYRDYGTVEVVRGDDGAVRTLSWHGADKVTEMPRVAPPSVEGTGR